MRNDRDFWKNICQVKYEVFRSWRSTFFFIFSTTYAYYYLVTLENITNNFPLG